MLGLGKYSQIRFYIEYSINTHVLVLGNKGLSIVQKLHVQCDS